MTDVDRPEDRALLAELEAKRLRPCPVGGCEPVERVHAAVLALGKHIQEYRAEVVRRDISTHAGEFDREPTLIGIGKHRWRPRTRRLAVASLLVSVLVGLLAMLPSWVNLIRHWDDEYERAPLVRPAQAAEMRAAH